MAQHYAVLPLASCDRCMPDLLCCASVMQGADKNGMHLWDSICYSCVCMCMCMCMWDVPCLLSIMTKPAPARNLAETTGVQAISYLEDGLSLCSTPSRVLHPMSAASCTSSPPAANLLAYKGQLCWLLYLAFVKTAYAALSG